MESGLEFVFVFVFNRIICRVILLCLKQLFDACSQLRLAVFQKIESISLFILLFIGVKGHHALKNTKCRLCLPESIRVNTTFPQGAITSFVLIDLYRGRY